jgi:hypothetical protein
MARPIASRSKCAYAKPSGVTRTSHTNPDGTVCPNIARSATVAATAYVSPNAMVLDGAQVLDYAVVRGTAQVRDTAVVSGYAYVGDPIVAYDGHLTVDDVHANLDQIAEDIVDVSVGTGPFHVPDGAEDITVPTGFVQSGRLFERHIGHEIPPKVLAIFGKQFIESLTILELRRRAYGVGDGQRIRATKPDGALDTFAAIHDVFAFDPNCAHS